MIKLYYVKGQEPYFDVDEYDEDKFKNGKDNPSIAQISKSFRDYIISDCPLFSPLEVSNASDNKEVKKLEFSYLNIPIGQKEVGLLSLLLASRIHENGGPFPQLLELSNEEAKIEFIRLSKEQNIGALVGYKIDGEEFKTSTQIADYIVLKALKNNEAIPKLINYDCFLDIASDKSTQPFNIPKCLAIYRGLEFRNLLDKALESPSSFLEIVCGGQKKVVDPITQFFQGIVLEKNHFRIIEPDAALWQNAKNNKGENVNAKEFLGQWYTQLTEAGFAVSAQEPTDHSRAQQIMQILGQQCSLDDLIALENIVGSNIDHIPELVLSFEPVASPPSPYTQVLKAFNNKSLDKAKNVNLFKTENVAFLEKKLNMFINEKYSRPFEEYVMEDDIEGKKIKTSYFAKASTAENPVSISLWQPKGWKGLSYPALAPSDSILKEYKDGNLSMEEYTKRYTKEILGPLNPLKVDKELRALAKGNYTLICFEKSGDFCHRHIASGWIHDALTRQEAMENEKKKKAFHRDLASSNGKKENNGMGSL